MRFKPGDKVKFIDEVGGGVVTAVMDSKMVKVKTDDGFEMPVLSKDLMLDIRSMPTEEQERFRSSVPAPPPSAIEEEDSVITEINPWGTVKEEKGVYLAFEPHEQQWLLTGVMDVTLVNNTPYDLLYSIFLKRNGVVEGIDYSSVPSNSKIVIDTIEREEVDNWISGYIQILLHADSPKKVFMPVHSLLDVKPGRFFKEGSYKANTLLHGKAVIVTLCTLVAMEVVTGSEQERKTDSNISKAKSQVPKEQAAISKYSTAPDEAIVDLHIGELVDNILGMSSHEMLTIQINTFKKLLNSAMEEEYKKVTFIHGVGNGVLKNAIIKELDDYEGLENQMASIAKFGVGAIDVVINSR